LDVLNAWVLLIGIVSHSGGSDDWHLLKVVPRFFLRTAFLPALCTPGTHGCSSMFWLGEKKNRVGCNSQENTYSLLLTVIFPETLLGINEAAACFW